MANERIKSYRDLRVWQLAVETYKVTNAFPKNEAYGLTGQMRRSAVSVAANIAEGFGRESNGAFAQFLRTSQGSLKEYETHVLISQRVNLFDKEQAEILLNLAADIGKMLGSLIRKVISA